MKKLALATLTAATVVACGGGGNTEPDIAPVVTPSNQAPTVTISSDTNYDEQTTVSITANAADSDGNIASFAWVQTAGNAVTIDGLSSDTLSFTSPTLTTAETLSFEVTVTDDDGEAANASVSVTIEPVNQEPSVSIVSETSANEQTEMTITGAVSDADGTVEQQEWTQITGPTITIDDPSALEFSFTTPTVIIEQNLTFQLSATDNEGSTSTETISIQVLPVNIYPVANIEADSIVNPEVLVTVSGTSSSDSDGTIDSYAWNQTAGPEVVLVGTDSNTLTFTPTTAIEGETLSFKLTVTDNEGATHSDIADIYINQHPVAVAARYQIVQTGFEISIDANGSSDDGQIVSYNWTQTLGTPATIENANDVAPTFTANFSDDEKITFEVSVTDDMGLSSTDTVDIDVVKVNRFINDTGVTVSATRITVDSSCIATEHKVHDCERGRDVAPQSKVGAGAAGFDYTKLDASGNELAADASVWSCVRDNYSGLIWEVKTTDGGKQHNLDTYRWGGKGADGYTAPNKEGTYYDYWNTLVEELNDEALCGKTDWALPTQEELSGLVHRGNSTYLIDLTYFPNSIKGRYWASSTVPYDDSEAWIVDFGTTQANDDGPLNRATQNRVRLVSGGEADESSYLSPIHSDDRYIMSDDGTVTDLDTGLMWTRCVRGQAWQQEDKTCVGEENKATWLEALEAGVDNNVAGYENWRLPNVNELKTIFDITKSSPAVNTTAFPAMPTWNSAFFWSSTPDLAKSASMFSLAVTLWGDVDYTGRTSSSGSVLLVRDLHE